MIEFLACKLGRNDEVPNVELAESLCSSMDSKGIREIADGLQSKDQAVASDCIKVLYEIGYRKPDLIADYADTFIDGLSHKNNRIVWGSMTALAAIALYKPEAIYQRLPEIIKAYKTGSVITIDNSISVFAGLCKGNREYQAKVYPILIDHLTTCRAKEIPQHAERMVICIDAGNKEAFLGILDVRLGEMSEAQQKRITKLRKGL